MSKPDWDLYFLRLAYLAATRASCDRKHVGAIIATPDRRVVATGYNGSPSGMPDCDEAGHEMVNNSCVRTLHAESNAIDFAGRFAQGCTLYATVIPCYDCAKRIVNAGIVRVVYDEFYASRYGKSDQVVTFFESVGIEVRQFDSPGLALFKQKIVEVESLELELLKTTLVDFVCGCQETADKAKDVCGSHGKPRGKY